MTMNPNKIREEGFRLLVDGLGTAGAIRFLKQFDVGSGNYTEEREKVLADVTVDEIVSRIKKRKEQSIY